MLASIRTNITALIAVLLAWGTALLLWATREQPLLFGILRLDALSLFFLLAVLLALLCETLAGSSMNNRTLVIPALAVLALSTRLTPVIALAYVLLAIVGSAHTTARRVKDQASFSRPSGWAAARCAARL